MPLLIWLLLPHATSAACFLAAFWWISVVDTNRSELDLMLGVAGYIFGMAALVVSLVSTALVAGNRHFRPQGHWLAVHFIAVAITLYLGHLWMGAHIA
jgi:hypothetical protein